MGALPSLTAAPKLLAFLGKQYSKLVRSGMPQRPKMKTANFADDENAVKEAWTIIEDSLGKHPDHPNEGWTPRSPPPPSPPPTKPPPSPRSPPAEGEDVLVTREKNMNQLQE